MSVGILKQYQPSFPELTLIPGNLNFPLAAAVYRTTVHQVRVNLVLVVSWGLLKRRCLFKCHVGAEHKTSSKFLFKARLSISEAARNTNPINARSRSNHGSQWPAQMNVVLVPCIQSLAEAKQRHLKRSRAAKNVTADADPLLSSDLKNCQRSILLSREIVWGECPLRTRMYTKWGWGRWMLCIITEVKCLQTLENSRYIYTSSKVTLLFVGGVMILHIYYILLSFAASLMDNVIL